MRLPLATATLLFALSCAEELGARPLLRVRQAETAAATDAQASTTAEQTSKIPEPTQSVSPTKSEDGATATTTISTPTSDVGDGDVTSVITARPIETALSSGNANITFANATDLGPNELPLPPQLTPAFGVAGAILMTSGLGLGFVGIKHRPTQTFLSTSLLIALGIEVLIIYLLKPPVSNAVQGAYLIAGVFGGSALGALALIFQEVSEGFGCLLGGFSLAMWLLVLSPGGIIKNKAGKIIMIGLFCAASFSLYISRFTRVYGIITCTAFAGASAFVLGIDCFSRAGLKEFWVYIWDINDDIFPTGIDSYPITRDMRAEIGAVIVITTFGVLSQIKIWKIVKEQKAKREADRLAEQEARDAEEAEVGRDIEAQVARERGDWEGQYESKKQAEACVDSVAESEKSFNLDREAGTGSSKNEKRRSLAALSLRSAARSPSDRGLSLLKRKSSGNLDQLSWNNTRASVAPSLPPLELDVVAGGRSTSGSTSRLGSAAGTPGLGISHASSPSNGALESPFRDGRTVDMKRLSVASLSAHHAMQDAQSPFGAHEEDDDDDVASSIAATVAEAPDMDALSVRLSRPPSLYQTWSNNTVPLVPPEAQLEDEDDEALCLTDNAPPGASRRGSSPKIPTTPHSTRTGEGSYFSGIPGQNAKSQEDLRERLPKKLSRAASSYRTNEWAKEVSRAEPVPLEEVDEHTTDAVQIEMADAATAARAEENNAAPPPPAPPTPPPPTTTVKPEPAAKITQASSTPPLLSGIASKDAISKTGGDDWDLPLANRMSSMSSSTALNTMNTPMKELQRHSSLHNLASDMLAPSPKPQAPGRALTSQSVRMSNGARSRSSTNNLLDARQDRLDARLTTTSFMTPNARIPPVAASTSSDEVPRGAESQESSSSNTSISDTITPRAPEIDEEDMTLAQRKALVKHQSAVKQRTASMADFTQTRRESGRTETPANPWRSSVVQPTTTNRHTSNPIYDSHQPQRYSNHDATKQAMHWNQWRNSTNQADQQRAPVVTSDTQMDMLRAARMQAEVEKRMRDVQRRQMQEQMDQHMRMGGMNEAHQAALLRMQSRVKE